MGKYRHIQPPPELFLREFCEEEEGIDATGIKEYNDLIRYRFGLIDDYLKGLYIGIEGEGTCECCTCFRWVWTTRATTAGQTVFYPPLPECTLEDNAYQIVFARSSHQYYGINYTINPALNSITLAPGLPLNGLLTIYAMHHNDIQEAYYEQDTVGAAAPYVYAPPVTVDRAPGRQLVFSRNSARFLDSGRPGDEYTVSNTLNQLSLTAGLGLNNWCAFYRLMECGVLWHEEILATAVGQTIYTPEHYNDIVKPHDIGKMMVFQRTSFLHPGEEYVTDVVANTIEIDAPGMAVDQPLNVWVFR